MHIFFAPDITIPEYILSEEESKHCSSVLRLKSGDTVSLIDGKGNLYKSIILHEHPKKCKVQITETIPEFGKRPYYLHIAIAPTKNIERFEWFLEKATEIGIDEITPLLCEHSERRNINIERLNKIITAAVKQSCTAYHPVLNSIENINEFLNKPTSCNKFIAHCRQPENKFLKEMNLLNQKVLILIGPEGDFSEKEIILAKENGFQEISLGSSRLRTETAAIASCITLQIINQ